MQRLVYFIAAALTFVACSENDLQQIAALSNEKEEPVIVMKNAEIAFTDSALLKAVIAAGEVETYTYYNDDNEIDDQKLVMTQGVKADFYDKFEEINSTMTSEKATRFDKKRLTEIEGNVVVVNIKGDSLSSEYLLWDEEKNTISSDKDVRVKTEDEVIFAEGFESDVNFQEYSFKKVTGRMTLKK